MSRLKRLKVRGSRRLDIQTQTAHLLSPDALAPNSKAAVADQRHNIM